MLGSGQFGTVHKGIWVHEEDGEQVTSEVAVKSMRDGATDEDKVKFLQEAAIMGQFNQTNILRIRAIVLEGDSVSEVTQCYVPCVNRSFHYCSLNWLWI